jgi:predicted permease
MTAYLRRLAHRAAALFRGRRMDREMGDEMSLHIELQAEEYRKEGMEADAAAARARRDFGHVEGISEACRDERGFAWISQAGQDLRYGLRMLRRTPAFTAAAVLTLALGIGVNTAIFSLLDEILLRNLPVADPGGLVLFHCASRGGLSVPTSGDWENDPATGQVLCTSFSTPIFERFRRQNQTLAGIFAFAPISRMTAIVDGSAEVIGLGELVSGDAFSVLGVNPAAGRMIGAGDDATGAAPVAVISFGFWQRRFGASPSAVGKSILVNHVAVTIVGVSPRRFSGTLQVGDSPDIYLPLSLARALGAISGNIHDSPDILWWVQIMGRLRPGVGAGQVRGNLEGVLQQSAIESLAAFGAAPLASRDDWPSLVVGPGGQGLTELRHGYAREWEILMGLSILVLAIACTNIANLLLARGASRQREIGVRLAMGANRGRVVRQLLTESAMLAFIGGALAVPFAIWVADALVAMQPKKEGHTLVLDSHLDLRVFLVAGGISLLTGLIFGLMPALRATRVDINAEFQGGTRNLGGSRSSLGRALIVVQVALSLVLLVGSGLFARTLVNLQGVDLGFDRGRLLIFELNPNPDGSSFSAAARFNREVAVALRAVPGVASATFSRMPLLTGGGWNTNIIVSGRPAPADGRDTAMVNAVDADFFSTYGIAVTAGRPLGQADSTRAASVAVVNQAFAARFFGTEDPMGRTIKWPNYHGQMTLLEIVGIVRDAKYSQVRDPVPPTIYVPFYFPQADASAEATFAVRSMGNPEGIAPSVRAAVKAVNPLVPIGNLRTQEAQIAELSADERMFAWLSGLFSLLAVGLVSLGLYGLMSYAVLRRTGEIGLRMALGADAPGVLWMILRETLAVVGAGIAIGLGGAFAATRIVAAFLFGLKATDPATFACGALLLFGVALAAGWIPARRASRVDPMAALRCE